MRKTKIICTIGPASDNENTLREMMLAGMNVVRFNFSHGTYEEHKERLERVKKVANELGKPIALMQDTKGPEIRLRDFEGGKVMLEAGSTFRLTTDDVMGTAQRASITYKNLKNDISVGNKVLIDDGLIEMKVVAVEGADIVCEVVNGGFVSNHKGINVPGAVLSMPFISDVDREDILFGIKMEYDYIAASFVRCADDVLAVRKMIRDNDSKMKIISKIECLQGIENLDEILEASDGIMVARGDMGVEVPMEEVPGLQKKMISKALKLGKVVITATQMLESMIKNPRPTRAETTDVANAIYDGTSAIMLSGESAAGAYPVEAVRTMDRIAVRTEENIHYNRRFMKKSVEWETGGNVTDAICHACCMTAMDLNAAAIITVTMSGFTAGMIARYQPGCQVIGCAVDESVYRQMSMYFGVSPLRIDQYDDTVKLFEAAINASIEAGLIKMKDTVVIVGGMPLGVAGNTNMIRVIEGGLWC